MPASRSLIALLVGTVVFFALWLVALKPSSSSSGGSSSSQGLGQYQSDINKAKQAVGTSNASNAASGNENAPSPGAVAALHGSSASHTPTPAAKPTASAGAHPSSKRATKPSASSKIQPATAKQNMATVQAAIAAHKVLAMLFYNPAAADDQAVRQELGSVPSHGGRVVKLAIPLSQASTFTTVTQQVPLNLSPTMVLISPTDQVTEITGYSASFEIDQRVDDALALS